MFNIFKYATGVRTELALMDLAKEYYKHLLEFHELDEQRKLVVQKTVITFEAILKKMEEIGE